MPELTGFARPVHIAALMSLRVQRCHLAPLRIRQIAPECDLPWPILSSGDRTARPRTLAPNPDASTNQSERIVWPAAVCTARMRSPRRVTSVPRSCNIRTPCSFARRASSHAGGNDLHARCAVRHSGVTCLAIPRGHIRLAIHLPSKGTWRFYVQTSFRTRSSMMSPRPASSSGADESSDSRTVRSNSTTNSIHNIRK